MGIRFGSTRTLAVAGILASTGGAVVGARNLLTVQAEQARNHSALAACWLVAVRAGRTGALEKAEFHLRLATPVVPVAVTLVTPVPLMSGSLFVDVAE